jgi:acetyltransferase-like isoleucine patch superfamily enzyme
VWYLIGLTLYWNQPQLPRVPETLLPKSRIPIGHLVCFGWLPSPIKVWAYRALLGYRIGRRVHIAFGGVVVGEDVDLADHVEIGILAVVQGRHIRIGAHSSVGTMSYVSCERIEIGEDAHIREQAYVGGPQLPESRFTLGSRTIVLQMANINPTKPVTIGDDTGIGGHCLIFTHGAWLNVLDGYQASYEPVTLGKSVWLPWRVFVMPGSTIGDGSVIGANSLVSGNIPPCSLAVGTPAKVIRQAPAFPRTVTPEEKASLVRTIVSEFERFATYKEVTVAEAAPFRTYTRNGKTWRLLWVHADDVPNVASLTTSGDTVLSESALDAATRQDLRRRGVFWLDLAGRTRSETGSPLTEELALFLGRYGIRLPRYEP